MRKNKYIEFAGSTRYEGAQLEQNYREIYSPDRNF